MGKRIITRVVLVLSLCFMLAGCSVTYNENNEYIQFVKKDTFNEYPNITCGEAFDAFFDNPKWGYFNSDTGEDVVEFTGKCLYDDVEVEVLMQFTIDEESGSFDVNYLSINDISQNYFMLSAMLSAIFEQ